MEIRGIAGCAVAALLVAGASPALAGGSDFNWSGFFAGFNVGGAWSNNRTNYSYTSEPAGSPPGFEDVFGPDGPGPLNITGLSAVDSALEQGFIPASLGKGNDAALLGGAQLGFNAQTGRMVLGAVGDFDWMDGVRSTSFSSTDFDPLVESSTQTAGVRWLSTLRARLGMPMGNALLYATGGFAFGDTVASSSSSASDGSNTDLYAGSKSGIRSGYAIGAGIDYALTPNVVLSAEYLYYDLGTARYAVGPANLEAEGEGLSTSASHRFNGSVVRFGLDFRLGG